MTSLCDRCFLFNAAGSLVWLFPQIMIGLPLVDSSLVGAIPFAGAGWPKAAHPGGARMLRIFFLAGACCGSPTRFPRYALYLLSPVWVSLFFLFGSGISTFCGGFSWGLCAVVFRLLGAFFLGVSSLGPSATAGGSVALEGVLGVAIGP